MLKCEATKRSCPNVNSGINRQGASSDDTRSHHVVARINERLERRRACAKFIIADDDNVYRRNVDEIRPANRNRA